MTQPRPSKRSSGRKKWAGKGIAVDSFDSETGAGAERFIAPGHIVAWVIE
jgi:hypothetical protein